MSPKTDRLKVMEQMIAEHEISNQEELLVMLEKAGFELTQATLSRDLKQMKVVKAPNKEGVYIYTLSKPTLKQSGSSAEIPYSTGLFTVEFSGQMAVVKTRPGHASAIAYDIDTGASDVILGTIAGDDTILLIPREGISRDQVLETLTRLFKTN